MSLKLMQMFLLLPCKRLRISLLTGVIALALVVPNLATLLAQASEPDAVAIESVWQKANSKYDGTRREILKEVDRQANDGPFRPGWQSLKKYQAPVWYEDAKFGIFIHWGLYSVPAFANEWYSRNMYQEGSREYKHHVATYGAQSKFGYKDFIPMFRAEHFDPREWARLFREAGAKYVVPVAEHHDGFPMYDSGLTDWCAGKMGPKRDVLGELANAIPAEGCISVRPRIAPSMTGSSTVAASSTPTSTTRNMRPSTDPPIRGCFGRALTTTSSKTGLMFRTNSWMIGWPAPRKS